MALTEYQEQQIAKIIEAFDNGRSLTQLTKASGTDPFKLMAEVVEGGETKKIQFAAMFPYLENSCAYGIEYDITVSDPAVTRIGNMALHRSLPIHNKIRGCLLDDNGNVVEYLDPENWTENVRDGSKGQVMVEIPTHWRKFSTIGNINRVMISEYPLPGYHIVPKTYVSAYEASLQRSTNKLSSVVNMSADYRGGNNTSSWDGTYRSLLGRPATSISRTNFRTYARNRNSAATSEWNCYVYEVHKTIYWLYLIEYASRNSQAAYNAELTSEGYKQGGLGAGVSTFSDSQWKPFNGRNSFVPCGTTDTLGNGSGIVSYTANNEDGTEFKTFNVPRYRGIENPFGHVWKWTDGCNIQVNPTASNRGNDLSKVYTCNDPAKFNDSNYDGYAYIWDEARSNGCISAIIFGETGCMLPSAVSGSSSTYYCDYHYTNTTNTSVSLRGLFLGGSASGGSQCGLSFACSYYEPSISDAYFGSRLCFIPQSSTNLILSSNK